MDARCNWDYNKFLGTRHEPAAASLDDGFALGFAEVV